MNHDGVGNKPHCYTQCAHLLRSSFRQFWILSHYQMRVGTQSGTMWEQLWVGAKTVFGERPSLWLTGGKQGQVPHHFQMGPCISIKYQACGYLSDIWIGVGGRRRWTLGLYKSWRQTMNQITCNVYTSILSKSERKQKHHIFITTGKWACLSGLMAFYTMA